MVTKWCCRIQIWGLHGWEITRPQELQVLPPAAADMTDEEKSLDDSSLTSLTLYLLFVGKRSMVQVIQSYICYCRSDYLKIIILSWKNYNIDLNILEYKAELSVFFLAPRDHELCKIICYFLWKTISSERSRSQVFWNASQFILLIIATFFLQMKLTYNRFSLVMFTYF